MTRNLQQRQHYIALDGLRGVASICVVAYHIGYIVRDFQILESAYLAVDFFFILSGFVIDYAYRDRLRGAMSVGAFVRVRIIRLYPLIVMGAIIGTAGWILFRVVLHLGAWRIVASFPFAALCIPDLFNQYGAYLINPPAWSLFWEIVVNLLFAAFLATQSNRAVLVFMLSCAAALIWIGFATGTILWNVEHIQFGFARVGFGFAAGMLLNRVAVRYQGPSIPFWLAALILIATFLPKPLNSAWYYELAICFFVYPTLILAAQAAHPKPRWIPVATASAFLSYPLYILHWPLLALIDFGVRVTHSGWNAWWPVVAMVPVAAWAFGNADARLRRRLSSLSPPAMMRSSVDPAFVNDS